ncbi:iron chaperone [Rothia sp. ZJ932]|uniref:iron chaperone n=1 Tax=Rothia sp. ZJ932 TaxID=2810516 RepID=UPI001F07D272|nr:DUF1801 domain-containing protein [Rothia sp. ZJ932]
MTLKMAPDEKLLDFFAPILGRISDDEYRARAAEVLLWVHETFPELGVQIAWNQPMFTHHGTYIIGFSYASKHLSVAPEQAGINHISQELDKQGISYTPNLFRLPWTQEPPYELICRVIAFNIEDKAEITSFWR